MSTLSKMRTGTVESAAKTFINDGKNLADALYDRGVDTIIEVEKSMQEYSDSVLTKIQQKPVTSMLISGGIGFILALFLRK